jgi:hypothetical protein
MQAAAAAMVKGRIQKTSGSRDRALFREQLQRVCIQALVVKRTHATDQLNI